MGTLFPRSVGAALPQLVELMSGSQEGARKVGGPLPGAGGAMRLSRGLQSIKRSPTAAAAARFAAGTSPSPPLLNRPLRPPPAPTPVAALPPALPSTLCVRRWSARWR